MAQCLMRVLQKEAHQVEVLDDGEQASTHLGTFDFDLIVLDRMLPGCTGLDICKRYRRNGGDAQILMLTALSDVDNRAEGLDAGADDYLAKPFHMKEFVARVNALLRRSNSGRSSHFQFGDLRLNTSTAELEFRGQKIQLLKRELEILLLLCKQQNRSFSAEELLNRLWSADRIVTTETVRTHIKNLRRKLATAGLEGLIEHSRGFGYRIKSA